jgi:hypothetical protein
MSFTSRILAVMLSILLLGLIIELVRRNRLKEKYALLWIITGMVILIMAVFDKLLIGITVLLGIALPINTMFFLGTFFIILINIHFSTVISKLSEQNKKLAQKVAMLEAAGKR